MSISMIIWTIVLFLIFRFLVKYILPILRITKEAGARMRQMQEQMNNAQQPAAAPKKAAPSPRPNNNDYIDYEEIK